MDFPPIGQEVQQEQQVSRGMSNADLYIAELIRHTTLAIDHAETQLGQARESLNRIRAAHSAGVLWQ